jgi:hypothetical protein
MEALYGSGKGCYADDNCPYAAEEHDEECDNCPYYELIFPMHQQQLIILSDDERIEYFKKGLENG